MRELLEGWQNMLQRDLRVLQKASLNASDLSLHGNPHLRQVHTTPFRRWTELRPGRGLIDVPQVARRIKEMADTK